MVYPCAGKRRRARQNDGVTNLLWRKFSFLAGGSQSESWLQLWYGTSLQESFWGHGRSRLGRHQTVYETISQLEAFLIFLLSISCMWAVAFSIYLAFSSPVANIFKKALTKQQPPWSLDSVSHSAISVQAGSGSVRECCLPHGSAELILNDLLPLT